MKVLLSNQNWACDVRRAAAILYDAGATAVWLFGSRAGARSVDRLSDFDLAVEGLVNGTSAILQASRELRGRVDVIRLESAAPALRWGIAQCRVLVPRISYSEINTRTQPSLPNSLAGMRTSIVAQLIRNIAPKSFIDFGCGYGGLLAELAFDVKIERLTGVDFNYKCIANAKRRIGRALGPGGVDKIELLEGIFTHRDPRFLRHEAAAAVEVIEHLEPPQLDAFVSVVFDYVRPTRIIITTPNTEYNNVFYTRRPHGRRHPDHRFEWSRHEFTEWSNNVGVTFRYEAYIKELGSVHPLWGAPTQIAIFDRIC